MFRHGRWKAGSSRGILVAVAALALATFLWSASVVADTLVITLDPTPETDTSATVKQPSQAMQLRAPTVPQRAQQAGPPEKASHQQETVETPQVGQIGVISSPYANIYQSRARKSRIYSAAKKGTPVAIIAQEADWYGILMANGWTGWLHSKHVKLTDYLLVQPENSRGAYSSRGGSDRANALITTAMAYMGIPYRMGGTDPGRGMDCSAYVQQVFARSGVSLPRTARSQARVGNPIPLDQIQPGDRLYFSCKRSYIDHCGIYIGGGQFIHCNASHGGVGIDDLTRSFFWQNLVTVRRS